MKTAAIILISFALGMHFAKWDSKHGAAFGHKMGVKTRNFFSREKP